MTKITKYIDVNVPVTLCNLKCPYCYISKQAKELRHNLTLNYSPKIIRKALSIKRFGGICLFNFCGAGETLIPEIIIDVIKEILMEGHIVSVVTNGVLSKRFHKFAEFDKSLTNHLFFKFSFHYLELKKRNLLDVFFNNLRFVRQLGCSFSLEITPSDELIPYIKEIKSVALKEVGAFPHVTFARNDNDSSKSILSNLPLDEYIRTWSTFDSELFNFKIKAYQRKIKEFCYAGDWSLHLNLETGILRKCYNSPMICNIYQDLQKPIKFLAIGNKCRLPYCYNAHVFLTLGDVPELYKDYSYSLVRNRFDVNTHTEWLTPEMKEILSSKFEESNNEYNFQKKLITNLVSIPFFRKITNHLL